MCHLIFLIPLIGIPLFWILPVEYSLSINILLWIITGLVVCKIVRAMMMPAKDGFKSLIGTEATVISSGSQDYGRCLVKAGHELWTVRSTETLHSGERVKVTAADGIKLVVRPIGKEKEVRTNEWHCH